MRGETNMEEFTSIAIWVLMIFLAINASIIWFDNSSTFTDNGLSTGITSNDSFGINDINESSQSYYKTDCSTSTSNALDYSLCTLSSVGNVVTSVVTLPGRIVEGLWLLLTAWVSLLNTILLPVPGGSMFINILVPFFGLIEFVAIFIITMKIAGIIRGGS